MNPLRVILDSNVFGDGSFNALEASPILSLVKSGKVQLIYGDVFLEELISTYEIESKRSTLLDRWLPFISATCSVIGEELPIIWHQELVRGRGLNSHTFMSPARSQYLLSELSAAERDGSWRTARDTIFARSDLKQRMVARRIRRRELREKIAKSLASGSNLKGALKKPLFSDFRSQFLMPAGRKFIEGDIDSRNPIAVANRWARSPSYYPYFTQFVVNHLYGVWSCSWAHDKKLDINAQQDLDIMTHLLRADVLVTNERKFMRSAFDDLWRPRGKVVFDLEEFVELIRKLV